EDIDSEKATSLSIKVEEAFGRRLVVEALRGQIVLPDTSDPLQVPPPPPPPPFDHQQSAKPEESAKQTAISEESSNGSLTQSVRSNEVAIQNAAIEDALSQITVVEEIATHTAATGGIVARPTRQAFISEEITAEPVIAKEAAVTARLDEKSTPVEEPQNASAVTKRLDETTQFDEKSTASEQPQSVRKESAPSILLDESLQPPPSEIASELVSELATLASTLASDLLPESIEYEPPAFVEAGVAEIISSHVDHKMTFAEPVSVATSGQGAIRVTEDLSMRAPASFGNSSVDMVLSLLKPDGL